MLTGLDGSDIASEIGEDAGEEETSRNDKAHIDVRLKVRFFRNLTLY